MDTTNAPTDTTNNEPADADGIDDSIASDPRSAPGYRTPLDLALLRRNDRPGMAGPSLWSDDALATPSITLQPGNIAGIEGFDADLDTPLLSGVIDAMAALHDTTAKVIGAREAARSDPTMTESAQILAVDHLHAQVWPLATRKVDSALANLGRQINAMEASMKGPVVSNAGGPLAAEVRSYVRSLTAGERQTLLSQALVDGDAVTAGAVLGCPVPYLSGITKEMQSAMLGRWHELRNPNAARQLKVLHKARAALEAAGSVFVASMDRTIGAKQSTVQRIRAQRDKVRRVIGAVA